ncbi:MAG: hypothetical protein R3254_05030 [Thiomicrorhabdus sp.]|nr:hypothetical protein [Thiomicrorhabdus sp.]
MKVNRVVYVVLGFALISGLAYWAVNYFVPTVQPELMTKNSSLEPAENMSKQSQPSQVLDGFTRPGKTHVQSAGEDESARQILKQPKAELPTTSQPEGLEGSEVNLGVKSLQSEPEKDKTLTPEEDRRAKLNVIREELTKIAKGDPQSVDLKHLDGLLVELQEMGDENGVVGGVNIPQLRKIIEQSNKIIQTSQNKGLLPGEDKNQKLKDQVQTLQDLQQGMIIKNE